MSELEQFAGKKLNDNIYKYEEKFNGNLAFCLIESMHVVEVDVAVREGYHFRVWIGWDGSGNVQDHADFAEWFFTDDFTIVDLMHEITV